MQQALGDIVYKSFTNFNRQTLTFVIMIESRSKDRKRMNTKWTIT